MVPGYDTWFLAAVC